MVLKYITIYCVFTCLILHCFSQETSVVKSLPEIALKTVEGKSFNTSEIKNGGKPVLIVFWKICCKLPEKQLDALAELYDKWKAETGVKIIAVSIDDSKTSAKVAPFVNGKGWEFDVLLDVNSDFKRAMNVVSVPHTFLLNGRGEIVWQKVLFNDGDETEIFNQIIRK